MAKTRRPLAAKKKRPAKPVRAKSVKKAATKAPKKKAVKRAMAVPAVKKVELKVLRKQFADVLAALSTRRDASPEVSERLDDTRRRISQWMTDVDAICADQGICGPDMAFPLA